MRMLRRCLEPAFRGRPPWIHGVSVAQNPVICGRLEAARGTNPWLAGTSSTRGRRRAPARGCFMSTSPNHHQETQLMSYRYHRAGARVASQNHDRDARLRHRQRRWDRRRERRRPGRWGAEPQSALQPAKPDDGGRRAQRVPQLVNAAAQVCPQDPSHPYWVSKSVQQCREQAIARAVYKINDPKLVAVYQMSSRNG